MWHAAPAGQGVTSLGAALRALRASALHARRAFGARLCPRCVAPGGALPALRCDAKWLASPAHARC